MTAHQELARAQAKGVLPVYPVPVIPGTRYFEASWLPYDSRTEFWVINGHAFPKQVHYHITGHAVYLSPAFSSLLRPEQ